MALCPRTAFVTGATLHHMDQYRPDLRAEARRLWPVGDVVVAAAIAPGSPAARAGLRVGDGLLAVNETPLPASGSAVGRVRLASRQLQPSDGRPLRLRIRRPAGSLELRIEPVSACRSRVQLVPSRRARASADGELVTLTTALLAFTRDENELAFVVAHEIAHNALGHAERRKQDGGVKARELAADRLALRLMRAAGYRTDAVLPLIERLYRTGPASGLLNSFGHLGRKERVAALRAQLVGI